MNGYDLIKAFYDRVAELPDMQARCKPHHLSLYTWLCELHNRTKRSVMDLPRDYTMSMSFIGSPNTFRDAVNDLQSWQLIEVIQQGNNQWQTTKVKLAGMNSYQHNTSTIPAQYQQDTGTNTSTVHNLKEESTKGDKGKKGTNTTYPPEYETFWKLYAKPTASKKEGYAEWLKLKPDERAAAVAVVPAYLNIQPEARYRKDPERFFKSRMWENDFNAPAPTNGQILNTSTITARPNATGAVR